MFPLRVWFCHCSKDYSFLGDLSSEWLELLRFGDPVLWLMKAICVASLNNNHVDAQCEHSRHKWPQSTLSADDPTLAQLLHELFRVEA